MCPSSRTAPRRARKTESSSYSASFEQKSFPYSVSFCQVIFENFALFSRRLPEVSSKEKQNPRTRKACYVQGLPISLKIHRKFRITLLRSGDDASPFTTWLRSWLMVQDGNPSRKQNIWPTKLALRPSAFVLVLSALKRSSSDSAFEFVEKRLRPMWTVSPKNDKRQ